MLMMKWGLKGGGAWSGSSAGALVPLVLSSDVLSASWAFLLFLLWYLLQRLSRRTKRRPTAKKATTPMKVASILVLLMPVTNDN